MERAELGGTPGEWVTPARGVSDRIIVYLHGGGYVMGSAAGHRGVIARIAEACEARAFGVEYPLAPEHPYPAALNAVLAVWEALLAHDVDPKNAVSVIGMGDIALRQGLWGDAISHLKKAARLAPKSSRVFTLLGEAYLNSGQNAIAAENFKKALQLDPDNARAREGYNEASSRVPPPEDDR